MDENIFFIFNIIMNEVEVTKYDIEYKDRENEYNRPFYIIDILKDNYYRGIRKMKYSYFKSTGTSNRLNYTDLCYYSPGIGIEDPKYSDWVVKENSRVMSKLFDKDGFICKIYKCNKDIEDIEDNLIKYCSLPIILKSIKKLKEEENLNDTWEIQLLKELFNYYIKYFYYNYLISNIPNFIRHCTTNMINDPYSKFKELANLLLNDVDSSEKEYISKTTFYFKDIFNIHLEKDIINKFNKSFYKLFEFSIPCYLIHRFKFYHKLQLSLQLSKEWWSVLNTKEEEKDDEKKANSNLNKDAHPFLWYIINYDYDYTDKKFVRRTKELKQLKINRGTIIKITNEEDYKKFINNITGWDPSYYDKFVHINNPNESIISQKKISGGIYLPNVFLYIIKIILLIILLFFIYYNKIKKNRILKIENSLIYNYDRIYNTI